MRFDDAVDAVVGGVDDGLDDGLDNEVVVPCGMFGIGFGFEPIALWLDDTHHPPLFVVGTSLFREEVFLLLYEESLCWYCRQTICQAASLAYRVALVLPRHQHHPFQPSSQKEGVPPTTSAPERIVVLSPIQRGSILVWLVWRGVSKTNPIRSPSTPQDTPVPQ